MCLLGAVTQSLPTAVVRPHATVYASANARKNGWLRAKINGEADPLLLAATNAASLRFQETHRPEPLFLDPYAGCLIDPTVQMDLKKYSHHYCLATKFIDDKLLQTVSHIDGLKQVVILTDGMDTRPYRLNWPISSIIFDISPERIFKKSSEMLKGVGARIPRSCMLLHIPLESSNIQQSLCSKGFNGNQPSIWAMQGLSIMTLASFEEILLTVGSLAINGSLFVGELPAWLAETELGSKASTEKWMEKIFMNNGFRVDTIHYNEVARNLGKELAPKESKNILFVAEQLRFSDDQMEIWRRELHRIEEEGDEEGFEEL
ncbi:O-methyltransferase 1, chloroplastic [Mercurialis annua]|uniref:O-methyltransferase 1, chloroplastic n=1 Tax=Mercurialis annua TaxID=3986 RepID=UPI002160189C|nr:O-methyltransferase 1, chloroplastic [Mercurialis annua]